MPAATAVLGLVGPVGSALLSSNAASRAAKASTKADQAAIAEQQRQFDLTRQDYAPYRTVGAGALNQLAALYGLPQYQAGVQSPLSYEEWVKQNGINGDANNPLYGSTIWNNTVGKKNQANYQNYLTNFKPSSGVQQGAGSQDFSAFYNSPDYNFARTEGQRGLEQSAAARGGAFSGNALKALSEYNQGLASQQFGNYYNRMAGLAGIGQSATNSLAQVGSQYSGNIANLMSGIGQTRASGILGQTAPWTNLLGSVAKGIGGGIFG